jgi:hypothetical protein
VEDLLSGLNEWRNIQDIVRLTFKALADVVKAQGQAIKDLERQMPQKATRADLSAAVSTKANAQDLSTTVSQLEARLDILSDFERELQEKASRTELQAALKTKASLEDIQNVAETVVSRRDYETATVDLQRRTETDIKDLTRKMTLLATKIDVDKVIQALQDKASIADLEEGLAKKANKESVASALHRKANRTDVETALTSKVDLVEIQEIHQALDRSHALTEQLSAQLEEKADRQEITQHILPDLARKLDRGDLEEVHRTLRDFRSSIDKRQTDQSLTLDSHLGALRGEIDHVRVTLSSAINKKADTKDIDSLVAMLAKKPDTDYVSQIIAANRDEIAERFETINAELKSSAGRREEQTGQRLVRFESDFSRLEDEMRKTREQLIGVMEDRRRDAEDTSRQLVAASKALANDFQGQFKRLNEEIAIVIRETQDLAKDKADRQVVVDLAERLQIGLDAKAGAEWVQEEVGKWEEELRKWSHGLQDLVQTETERIEESTAKQLSEIHVELAELQKMANAALPSAQLSAALSSCVQRDELDNLKQTMAGLRVDIIKKANQSEMDQHIAQTRSALEDVARDIVLKANIKDVCTLLDMKASTLHTDIDDVNKALVDMKRGSDAKLPVEDFRQHLRQQTALNDILTAVNVAGRWAWRSGELRAGNAVPWEVQLINTHPDNFLWERDKSTLLVVSAGLYQVSFGFFARKKPNVQLLVNGEPILTSTSAPAAIQTTRKGVAVTGLTLVDFLNLPARARLALCYTGDTEAEGFLALSKL